MTMDDLFTWAEQQRALPVQPACTPPADPLQTPPEWPQIWAILEGHRGQAAAITAPQIAAAAGLWPHLSETNRGTKVRKILELAQDSWPAPICGDADGYYVAADPAELDHYCANLRSRALCIHRRFASFRRAGRRAGFQYHGHGRWSAG